MNSFDLITTHFRLTAIQKSALKRLRLETISELLYHFPTRYESGGDRKYVREATFGSEVTLYGQFTKLETKKSWKSRIPITQGTFEDGSGRIPVMWFHQPYIAKMIPVLSPVKVTGKITGNAEKPYLANPKVETLTALPASTDSLIEEIATDDGETPLIMPVYPETKGVTSLWFFHAMKKIFSSGLLETSVDPLPEDILNRYHLPTFRTAIQFIHTPQKMTDTEVARKRFAFEEVLCVQLIAQQRRYERTQSGATPIALTKEAIKEFTDRFPFSLTDAQHGAIETIVADMAKTSPMSRLLEGDVGSGKTAVAATVSYAAIMSRDPRHAHQITQIAYMAPTEVLAKQLYESFIGYFKHLPVKIGLLTSHTTLRFPSKTDPTKPTDISRAQLLKWTASGDVHILIGTHSLIQKTVEFRNLALVIIDEQHRFGTKQRMALTKKHAAPHLLSMTATPIPRTLALTIYGDLDLTLLDAMPPGRKPIITTVVDGKKRADTYVQVIRELETGRQAYIICPRIDAPDPSEENALQAKSVAETIEELRRTTFKKYRLAALHSKLSQNEKDEVMAGFAAHRIDILVATSVVEVGVNVPNATVIIIEGAERFGLSQLHQLRGRVIRSAHQAYCFLFVESKGEATRKRMHALTHAKNGFELAEYDLGLRGSGQLYGGKQWGVTDLGMEAIKNIKLVEAARLEAKRMIEIDPLLSKSQSLKARALQRDEVLHFE
jgi:ATP-dependent DNA helicase RecG